MAIKKSELYSSLWKSCDELRGGMDASQYKDYVLVLLFLKYVSDKYAGQPDALIEVPEGGGFKDMVALKGDKEIGDKINKIIARLAEANDLRGVIDVADFNDADKLGKGKEMQDRLSNLVGIFENPELDFRSNRAEGDDILGDAYEYLMRHFATESGKSKGQFYTPAEVSRIMAKVIGVAHAKSQSQTIYDPTCGSASLLLKAADESKTGVTIYGQERDNATAALAKMNMILHNHPTAEIWQDNTLSSPHFKQSDGSLKTFDYVVANPPFSTKSWSNGFDPAHDLYGRFVDGIPPTKNGDYAFLLHILRSLKSTGKGAVILPHGVLFRGNAEGNIRRNIVRKGYIKGIIGLPANLFYGTGIPACILVLDKEHAAVRTDIFMIDASKSYQKDGNKNRLRHQDIHKIVDVFTRQLEIPKYSRMVALSEIEGNDYNLNIPRYIDSSEPEDLQDIEGHLKGGLPNADIEALAHYWQVFPTLQKQLFEASLRPGYSQMKVQTGEIRSIIFAHPEFAAYTRVVKELFDRWRTEVIPRLEGIAVGDHPKALIEEISEALLQTFAKAPLIDPYAVYQHLMHYWTETMQDDVYMVVTEGWQDAAKIRLVIENKENKNKEKPDFQAGKLKYKADFIPPALLVARYFPEDQHLIESLEADAETVTGQMEEMDEEHGGEEGLLYEARTKEGKLTQSSIKDRLKEIRHDKDADDEREILEGYLSLLEEESAANKKTKEARKALEFKIAAQYSKLEDETAKSLLVEDKWLTTLSGDVQSELDRISQALTTRIKELAERYAKPLPILEQDADELSAKVEAHLEKMGFVWK